MRAATQGLELARSRKEKGNEAWALYMLGEVSVHAARNGAQTAEAHYHEALALATELGMRPLIAHCHFGLRHYLHTGRADCTRENVVTAATMYREMEMQSWLEKAEAALKDLSGKL